MKEERRTFFQLTGQRGGVEPQAASKKIAEWTKLLVTKSEARVGRTNQN